MQSTSANVIATRKARSYPARGPMQVTVPAAPARPPRSQPSISLSMSPVLSTSSMRQQLAGQESTSFRAIVSSISCVGITDFGNNQGNGEGHSNSNTRPPRHPRHTPAEDRSFVLRIEPAEHPAVSPLSGINLLSPPLRSGASLGKNYFGGQHR